VAGFIGNMQRDGQGEGNPRKAKVPGEHAVKEEEGSHRSTSGRDSLRCAGPTARNF
jgi:hypothetical protein